MSQEQILRWLKEHEGVYTSRQIKDAIGLSMASVLHNLRCLRRDRFILFVRNNIGGYSYTYREAKLNKGEE